MIQHLNNPYWSREIQRLSLIVVLAAIFGALFDLIFVSISLALLVHALWLQHQILSIKTWIDNGAKLGKAPDVSGVGSLLIGRLHSEFKRNRKRRKRHRKMIKNYQAAAKALPDATVVLAKDNTIIWANLPCENLLGIRLPRDIGLRIDTLIRDPKFNQFIQNKKNSLELESTAPRNDKITLLYRLVSYGQNNLLIARDISQRTKLREERRQFVANVSHELRTPITVIKGYLELLPENNQLPVELSNSIENIRRQSTRMDSLVEDLLVLARLEQTDHGPTHGKEIKIKPLLQGLLDDIEISHPNRYDNVTLYADEGGCIVGQPTEIISLCSNLINNALTHTPEDSEIDIEWRRGDHHEWRLSVMDNGPGVPADQVPQLTQRFYRGDDSRQRTDLSSGTGLGLAIVKHIAERHHAQIQIESDKNQGFAIHVIFPTPYQAH